MKRMDWGLDGDGGGGTCGCACTIFCPCNCGYYPDDLGALEVGGEESQGHTTQQNLDAIKAESNPTIP